MPTPTDDLPARLRHAAAQFLAFDSGADAQAIRDAAATIERLQAENQALRAELRFARDEVDDWGAYASDYFKTKHDLAGTLARLDAALKDHP